MSNRKLDLNDPFAALFVEAEKSNVYWEERARLEFIEKVIARMKELSLNRSELARRLDAKPSFVTRLLSGTQNCELTTMARVSRALDCELRCHLQPQGTETLWINVLKSEPERATTSSWAHSPYTIVLNTSPRASRHEDLVSAA